MITDGLEAAELGTGVSEVDLEHDLLIQLVEAIRGALEARRDRAAVSALLQQLEEATRVHFLSEELLMRLHAWDRYEPHVQAHQRLLDDLAALRRDLETGPAVERVVALDQLQSWLAGHIRGMDRSFAQHLARARS
jgi:hemerythrin-like metal-binding protein